MVGYRLCRDRPLFTETLDVIKFICKDIWAACWDKQVDNLRTNHRVSMAVVFASIHLLTQTVRAFMFCKITRSSRYHGSPPGMAEQMRHGEQDWCVFSIRLLRQVALSSRRAVCRNVGGHYPRFFIETRFPRECGARSDESTSMHATILLSLQVEPLISPLHRYISNKVTKGNMTATHILLANVRADASEHRSLLC